MNPRYTDALKRIRTPHKLNTLVLAPSYKKGQYDSHAVDCPFVFAHDDRFYMTHIGWDSVGYRTGLASSQDLVHWRKEGIIIDRGPAGSTTEFNAAMSWIVRENELFGPGTLKKIHGRFLGTYHTYPAPGYEVGPASIGICWSDDLRKWEIEEPFLFARDGGEWERGGLYKSCLVEHEGTFYMFYNAKTVHGVEQTGVATSTDLKTWARFEGNPIVKVGPAGSFDDRFASDPCVVRVGDVWAMFYYTYSTADGHARDSVAFSDDLLHWEKSGEVLIDVGCVGCVDSQYAHKPSVFTHNGKVYHFYCAVSPANGRRTGEVQNSEIRGISVATS